MSSRGGSGTPAAMQHSGYGYAAGPAGAGASGGYGGYGGAAPASRSGPPPPIDPRMDERVYRNIKPRTRLERRQLADKETLEKARLKARTGGFHRYEDLGPSVTSQQPESCAFVSEAERFITDTAGEEKVARDAAYERRQAAYIDKREVYAAKEEARWAAMDAARKEEEEKWQKLREDGGKARRNQGSVPYNPLTLKYHDSDDGLRLQHADDLIRFRAAQRAVNLESKNRSTDCNPITGEPLEDLQAPPKPAPLTARLAQAPLGGPHH